MIKYKKIKKDMKIIIERFMKNLRKLKESYSYKNKKIGEEKNKIKRFKAN